AQAYNAEISEKAENDVLDQLKAQGIHVIDVTDKTPWQKACAAVIEANTKDQAALYQQLKDLDK
ncbi:MAG: C4-dicarboxylate ABC transporter substrate-binding protein, partial [Sphaerochaetaceae bacterium]